MFSISLCFKHFLPHQMILILGFTPWRSHRDSQLISIVSSSFHLVKASAQLITFKNKKEKEDMVGVVEKLKNFVAKKLQLLRAICDLFPLLLSSVIFNVGTMALAISVLGWHSVWFLIGSLLLHLVLFFSLPFKLDLKMMKTFNLENHLPKEDADHPSKPFLSGLFFSSSNMFIFSCSSGAAKVNHFPYLPSIPIYFKISQRFTGSPSSSTFNFSASSSTPRSSFSSSSSTASMPTSSASAWWPVCLKSLA